MKKYYPYVSDKPNKKYFIITNTNKGDSLNNKVVYILLLICFIF